MTYDPEAPQGYQDADIEMASAYAEGARLDRLRAQGICAHGWVNGRGPVRCLEDGCGATWATEAEWLEARAEVLA